MLVGSMFKNQHRFGVMPKVTIIAGSSPAVSTNSYNEDRNMKSNKQRRIEIKAKRRKRAEALKADPFDAITLRPPNSVLANHAELMHNKTYGPFPLFYVDEPFNCIDCGSKEVWTAKNQKWWYEIAKGSIYSGAMRCLKCRVKIRREKEEQQKRMAASAEREPHPNEAFFKKRW